MIYTILNSDYSTTVLDYTDNSEFLKKAKQDPLYFKITIGAISPNYISVSDKVSNTSLPVKRPLPEKLPKKMRVKNSYETSKEMFLYMASKNKLSDMFKGSVSGITLKTQIGTVRAVPVKVK